MSCLETDIERFPGLLLADISRADGLEAGISLCAPDLYANVSREDVCIKTDIRFCVKCIRQDIERIDVELKAEIELICSVNLPEKPYLEIEPTVLWVYPDFENTNDVFSNTYWRIN